jgi:hypothetical protein
MSVFLFGLIFLLISSQIISYNFIWFSCQKELRKQTFLGYDRKKTKNID